MKFNVFAVTPKEYEKADKNSNYAPKEYIAGVIEADSEAQARSKLSREIKAGCFPGGSEISLIEPLVRFLSKKYEKI